MKNKMKKQAATMLVATMVVSGGVAYAAPSTDVMPVAVQESVINTIAVKYGITINGQEALNTGYLDEGSELIMLPLRELSEALGFEIEWSVEDRSAELSHPESPIWTLVQTDKDNYTINKMYKPLGAAPVIKGGNLYVPSNFFSEVLQANVSVNGNQVTIVSHVEEAETLTRNGVITGINNEVDYKSIHIDGAGTEGVIFNIDENTVIRNADGEKIELQDLSLGMDIQAVHSLAMTMSLPGQTYAYEISVQSRTEAADYIGTSGAIQEVRVDDEGNMSILVEGLGMTEGSPSEVVLMIQPETIIVDQDGKELESSELAKDAKVLAFYSPVLTRSLPPIGQAWKIVCLGQEQDSILE